jgi:hypothetical protein
MALRIRLHEDGTAIFGSVTPAEARLIWHALEAHKKTYLESLDDMMNQKIGGVEDEMFIYGQLAEIATMQFHLLEDHSPAIKHAITSWLGL